MGIMKETNGRCQPKNHKVTLAEQTLADFCKDGFHALQQYMEVDA